MTPLLPRLLATLVVLFLPVAVCGQESKALVDALVRKGILTNDEASAIVAEVRGEAQRAGPLTTTATGNSLQRLTVSSLVQAQFAHLNTTLGVTSAQPPATSHFLTRRALFGLRGDLADRWSATLGYDFASSEFEVALASWKWSDRLVIDAGLRKVPFLLDETLSNADLAAIERSPVTEYFDGPNNGRRLGAGAQHVGVFVGGAVPWGIYWNAAITNPERVEGSLGASSTGYHANNRQAFWANVGVMNRVRAFEYRLGVSGGYLPDQGGAFAGRGDNLAVAGAYADVKQGGLRLRAEYVWSFNENGVAQDVDATPTGFYVMPSYRLGNFEAVVRYSRVDSDGHGIDISDAIHGAPSSGALDKLSEWFFGVNWYLRDNDTKLQLGYLRAEARDALTGAPSTATTDGIRSQLQVSF